MSFGSNNALADPGGVSGGGWCLGHSSPLLLLFFNFMHISGKNCRNIMLGPHVWLNPGSATVMLMFKWLPWRNTGVQSSPGNTSVQSLVKSNLSELICRRTCQPCICINTRILLVVCLFVIKEGRKKSFDLIVNENQPQFNRFQNNFPHYVCDTDVVKFKILNHHSSFIAVSIIWQFWIWHGLPLRQWEENNTLTSHCNSQIKIQYHEISLIVKADART